MSRKVNKPAAALSRVDKKADNGKIYSTYFEDKKKAEEHAKQHGGNVAR